MTITREDKVAQFLRAAGKTPWLEGDDYELFYENNLKEETKELAVMVDTFHPLLICKDALELEDPTYYQSWME